MKSIVVWVVALLLLVIAPFHEASAKTVWHMHLNYPAGNFHSQGAQRFAPTGQVGIQKDLKKIQPDDSLHLSLAFFRHLHPAADTLRSRSQRLEDAGI